MRVALNITGSTDQAKAVNEGVDIFKQTGAFAQLPEELRSLILKAIIDSGKGWEAFGRFARTCKMFLSEMQQPRHLLHFFKQGNIGGLGLSRGLALKLLRKRCLGERDVELAFLTGPHFLQAEIQELTKVCRYKKFMIKESETQYICDAAIEALASHSPELEHLHLHTGHTSGLTDQSITSLSKHCAKLHTLSLWSTHLSDRGLEIIAEKWPTTMRDLTLCFPGSISSVGLNALRACVEMTRFKLLAKQAPSDELIADLVGAWPRLEVLELRSASKLTAQGMAKTLLTAPKLEKLILDNFTVTKESLQAILRSTCPLRELTFDISCTSDISSDEILASFIECHQNLPHLRAVHLRSWLNKGCEYTANSKSLAHLLPAAVFTLGVRR